MGTEDNDDPGTLTRLMAAYGHVGMMFPVAIGLGMLGGYWLDGWLGTSPWLMFVGFGLGVVAAVRNLVQTVHRQERAEREAEETRLRRRRQARRGGGTGPGPTGRGDVDDGR